MVVICLFPSLSPAEERGVLEMTSQILTAGRLSGTGCVRTGLPGKTTNYYYWIEKEM